MPSQDGVAADQIQDQATASSATVAFDDRRNFTHAAALSRAARTDWFGRSANGLGANYRFARVLSHAVGVEARRGNVSFVPT